MRIDILPFGMRCVSTLYQFSSSAVCCPRGVETPGWYYFAAEFPLSISTSYSLRPTETLAAVIKGARVHLIRSNNKHSPS